MRILLVALLILTTSVGRTQERPLEVYARFKPLGVVIFEDLWAWTFSAGTQVRLNQHFGLVIDVVHFHWLFEQEIYESPGSGSYYEVAQKDARNYLATELRYYPFALNRLGAWMPYINTYSKFGKRTVRSDDAYGVAKGEPKRMNAGLFDLGASLGFEVGYRFGFDTNIGFCYRWENQFQDIYNGPDLPMTYTENVAHNRFLFNIRVSFFWNFMGKTPYPA